MPAANWRFGATAAVTPQKRQCGNERLYPAGSVVEAATTPSRLDVVCKPAKARWKHTENDRELCLVRNVVKNAKKS